LFVESNAAQSDHATLEQLYRATSAAIVAEDVEALTKTSYRIFDADAADVRKTWEANFKSVAEYGPIEFRVENVKQDGDELIAVVTRRIFFRFEGGDEQQLEEGRSRDRWSRQTDGWKLVGREEVFVPLTGRALPEANPESPKLVKLQGSLKNGETEALDKFWAECAGHAPLVEPLADDAERLLVTFLWRDDDETQRVEVRGGPYDSSRTPFERLPGSDVWYHSERLPRDSRYVYSLIVNRRVARTAKHGSAETVAVETYPLDSLNPRVFNAGSVLELPDAPRDAWHVAREGVARGNVEHVKIDSRALSETRSLRVYRSPEADRSAPPRVLAVFLDGEDCEQLMSLPTVLDNLVADGKIPPLVAVMVDSQGTRGRDLVFHDPFVEFLADELAPWAAERYQVQLAPERTLVSGMSLGGLTATYVCLKRPEVFGNALSQSGSFWRRHPRHLAEVEGWLPGETANSPTVKVNYYLEVGRFEAPAMVENNRRMRDVLRAKGSTVTYAEFHGGHDHVNWRVSIGNGLISLFGKPR
jgi:enterochelin esterase family protein